VSRRIVETESWTDFKNRAFTNKNLVLSLQYSEEPDRYHVWVYDDATMVQHTIVRESPANADQTDFEDNYKDDANLLASPTVLTIAGQRRLAVDAIVQDSGGGIKTLDGNRYIVTTDTIAAPAAENAFVLIRNPADSLHNLFVERQWFSSLDNIKAIFRMYRNPTVTVDGTPMPARNAAVGLPDNSLMEAYLEPTVSAFGSRLAYFYAKNESFIEDSAWKIVVTPGNSVLITTQMGGANKDVEYGVAWVEEDVLV